MNYTLRFHLFVGLWGIALLGAPHAQAVRPASPVETAAVADSAVPGLPCSHQFAADVWHVGDFEFATGDASYVYTDGYRYERTDPFSCFVPKAPGAPSHVVPYLPPVLDPRILLNSPRPGGVLVIPVGRYWIELD